MNDGKPDGVIEAAWESIAMPPARDILRREYEDRLKRAANPALHKWGPGIEADIQREFDEEDRE